MLALMVSATVSECAVPTTAIRLMDGITLFPRRQRPASGGKSHWALNICFPARAERYFAVLLIVDAKVPPARSVKLITAKGMFQASY